MTTPATQAAPGQTGKPQGSPGSRGAKAGGGRGKPREITGFTAEDMVIKRPSTVAEKAKYRRKREERSDLQKTVDALILGVYEDWIRAGKPTKFVDMPLAVWPIRKAKEDDARFMLSKAAALIQRTLRFGDCPETEDGKKIELSFYVTDRTTKVVGAPDEKPDGVSE